MCDLATCAYNPKHRHLPTSFVRPFRDATHFLQGWSCWARGEIAWPPPEPRILQPRSNLVRRTSGRVCRSGECLNKTLEGFCVDMQHLKERNSTDGGMVGFDKGVLSRDPHQLRNNGTNANTTRRDEGSFVLTRHFFELKTSTATDP